MFQIIVSYSVLLIYISFAHIICTIPTNNDNFTLIIKSIKYSLFTKTFYQDTQSFIVYQQYFVFNHK